MKHTDFPFTRGLIWFIDRLAVLLNKWSDWIRRRRR